MGRVKTNLGFTLIEAAVAIGVVAILAGMIAPLGMKILDRQREEATRKSVQMIFEALFGNKNEELRICGQIAEFFQSFPVARVISGLRWVLWLNEALPIPPLFILVYLMQIMDCQQGNHPSHLPGGGGGLIGLAP